ncbi:MAG TPA: N-acetylmuramoyl-L-alanine amidase [Candidatus Limnocylindrales bacterium]|nr:N-acetylmuramoyl-L-alanine amidase [Candidatus Limnocylindrales bacterium]
MPDDQHPAPNDDQASREFEAWMKKRHLRERDDTPAAQEFIEMMRQAALRNGPAAASSDPALDEMAQAAGLAPANPPLADDAAVFGDEPDQPPASAPVQPPPPPRRRSSTRPRRGAGTLGFMGGFLRTLIIVLAAAGLTATIFTWFTPNEFINADVRSELSAAIATDSVTAVPTVQGTPNWARRIGIVSGHRGPENDPGAVCPDGLTEGEINFNVAQIVVGNLRALGYTVDLLDEFDTRLGAYQAAVLVSIHANTCRDFGEVVSGYLISGPSARVTVRDEDRRLVECVSENYAVASGLSRREGVTEDMTDYHNFREIDASTPAAILELGFLLADRPVLTERQDMLAQGITNGILCFLEPGPPSYFASTPAPSATPLTEATAPVSP